MRISTFLLAFILALLLASPALAQTCTTEWAAPISGIWSSDANWTNGAPDANDTACITASGTYVVTLDRRQALDGLVVGGASGLQTLVMDGTFDPLGSGTVGPNGRVELVSSENCGSCDGLPVVTGTLSVEGTLVHTTLVGLLSEGGTIDVAPGGTLRVDTGTNSVNMGSGATDARSRLVIRGRLLFDPADGATSTATVLGTLDLEGGTVDVLGSGRTVFVQSQGTWTGGTFSVAENMTVWLTAGNGSNGVYELTGTLDGSPAGRLLLTSGATFAAGSGGAALAFGGTGLRVEPGSGQTSFFTSAGGAFTNTGLIEVRGNGLRIDDAVLANEGTVDVRTNLIMQNGAELDNVAAGEVRFIDAGQVSGGPDGGLLRSAGRLIARLDANSSARSTIGVPIEIDGGSIETEDAGFFFGSQGLLRDVTFTANEDIWLAAGNGSNGVYRVEGTLSGTATGTLFFGLATLEAGPGGATLDIGGTGLQFLSGSGQQFTLQSAGGDFVNTGIINWGGNFNLMTGVALQNEGDLTVRVGGLRLAEGATLTNTAGATATFAVGGGLLPEGDNPGTFVNEGLVLKTEGGTTDFNNTLRSQQGSELRVLDGRFFFGNENPTNYGAGVLLSGTGNVFMSPPQLMQGTISPGTPDVPVDTLDFFSHFRMDATEGDARLVIDLGPDGASDFIPTNAQITLGGTLVVRVLDGYTPAFGDAFTIIRDLRNNAVQGGFSNIEVEGAPEGVSFAVDTSQPGAVVLRAAAAVAVSAPVADTPEGEPAPFVLTHPAAAEPFTINFALGGTATRFADYTVSATSGTVRAQANTTQTVVTLYPRRDANPNEGPEAVTLEVLLGEGAAPAPDAGQAGIAIIDGPSIDALALDGVTPAEGENLGTVTATVFGAGFGESATVSLDGPVTIQGETGEVTAFGARATFGLAGAPAGTYDVVVQSGGEDATLADGFTVTEGTPDVPVWASISGTPSPRFGRWSTYTLTVGNDGATDLYDTLVLLRITDELEYEITDAVPVPGAEEYSDITGFAVENEVVVPLYLYALDAGSTREIRVRVRPTSPINIGDELGVGYSLFPPNPEALFTYSGELDDFNADVEAGRRTNWAVLGATVDLILDGEDPATALRSNTAKAARVDPTAAIRAASASRLGGGCPTAAAGGSAAPPSDFDAASNFNDQLSNIASGVLRGAVFVVATGFAVVAATAGAPITATVIGAIGIIALITTPASASTCGTVGGSFDPNDKLGPGGWAEERFYRPTAGTPYTVRFENLDTATFPAQEVIIVDTLDTEAFDLSTFSFGPIRWGVDGEVVPPAGAQAFETEVSLAPEFDATLLITAALETETGRATWYFATLDNTTGDLPEDGTVGFLPPNATQPEGEGSVSFIVDAFPNLTTGTVVANQAEIVFDINEPIVTPVWINTVDVDAPSSSVRPIAGTEEGPVTIEVEGSDLGAGIQAYALFVSEADGPFELYEISREPTFEFEGEVGTLYGFYSIVTDYVFNTEGPKDEAEATLVFGTVANEENASLPREVTLAQPYPNPTRSAATLRWGLPEAGRVDVRVYDVLGREVVRLADGETTEAGWHEMRWNASLTSGVYIVRLQTQSGRQTTTKTQRLVIVR